MLIKSVSCDQAEIIKSILELYVPDKRIDCDPTYSSGGFYKHTGIEQPVYIFDICPQTDDTVYADVRNLPLADNSLGCVMFDPPFLATTGKSLSRNDGSNKINKRFGTYPNEKSLHKFYINAVRELYRVLKTDGILIFKIQDKVSSSKQYFSHCFVYEQAVATGFYPIDLFILLAKNRIVANWQAASQKHARKYHSYFWVFQKRNTKIQYI